MSKRFAGTAMLLMLFAAAAAGETHGYVDRVDSKERVVRLFDGDWELFRPRCREQTLFDLSYLTYDLVSARAGLGLRFHPSTQLAIDLEVDPFTDGSKLVGPLYDPGIGAMTLALRFSF